MPTDYTGVSTATQAPSGPPEPEGNPIVRHPADGDVRNASSIEQLARVAVDWIAWLTKPKAKLNDWAMHIMGYRTSRGALRSGFDHLALPAGQYLQKQHIWVEHDDNVFVGATSGRLGANPEWTYEATQVSGATTRADPILPTPADDIFAVPSMKLTPGTTANDFTSLVTGPYGLFSAFRHIVLECLVARSATFTGRALYIGFGVRTPGVGLPPLSESNHCGFVLQSGGTNWFAVSSVSGVGALYTDTGVAAVSDLNGMARLRVEFHGESASDDSNRRIRFYVDGVLRATHSTNIPTALARADVMLAAQTFGAGSGYGVFGPLRVSTSLLGNVATNLL